MNATLKRFLREEEGAALVEYGLLVGLIAIACVVSLKLLGTNINAMFNAIAVYLGLVKAAIPTAL